MPVLESLFNKVVGLKPCNFFKKALQHRCFPVNVTKFIRTPISKIICQRLLLSFTHQAATSIDILRFLIFICTIDEYVTIILKQFQIPLTVFSLIRFLSFCQYDYGQVVSQNIISGKYRQKFLRKIPGVDSNLQ